MYCKIPKKKVIKEAKEQFYDRLIAKSNNKTETTWNIIKNETAKMHPIEQVPSTEHGKTKRSKAVTNAFNNFFNNFRKI